MDEERQATPIEGRILDAIYGIRSRFTEAIGEMTLLLGPDEYAELLGRWSAPENQHDSIFGFPIRITSVPGVSFAWPTYQHDGARLEMERGKEGR